MSIIKVKDKTFKTSIPEAQILERVKAVADRINTDMADKNPLLLAMLNGSFIFAADLMRYINGNRRGGHHRVWSYNEDSPQYASGKGARGCACMHTPAQA